MYTVYTDGSCLGNPGPGGWAFIAIKNNKKLTVSGGERFTTNNKMELQAVIEALIFHGLLISCLCLLMVFLARRLMLSLVMYLCLFYLENF